MSRGKTSVTVGRHVVTLSNLDKVLFPADGIVKAELIDYYLRVAPTLLKHIKGRPLSLVRYPDGIDAPSFFQKAKPESAPPYVESVRVDRIEYVTATSAATLVWLANLACVELHEIATRPPHLGKADYLAFDFDPPEGYPFAGVVELALALRPRLEQLGYHPFVKTTGGKGVHVFVPVEPRWGFDDAFAAASEIATAFVAAHSTTTTLNLKKNARKGRVFIDVLRNHASQTTVCPYSVRGRPGAPVSTPVTWDELEALPDPRAHSVHTVPERLERDGDPWDAIDAYAAPLHTAVPKRTRRAPAKATEAALGEYSRKRAFEATPEPRPRAGRSEARRFVLHRHHATRIHYDLRLERDGVLKCWALPKGLPARPGLKHLAVATEDHPADYLSFEGTIPKGQYGGGRMWVYATGTYELTKEKKDGFYVRLQSRELTAEYRMIDTRDRQWLVERVEQDQTDWLRRPVAPMLASQRSEPFDADEWAYEVKWDGIRAMVAVDEGDVRITSRNGNDVTAQFPEIAESAASFAVAAALYDTEIVCLDARGRPVFSDVIRRLKTTKATAVAAARARNPAVCYVFDCLYLDGRPIVAEPWSRRRDWMADTIRPGEIVRVSEDVPDGAHLFAAVRGIGLEGIMAKRRDSVYRPGRRVDDWLKIKVRESLDCVVVGYTTGKGDLVGSFGALQLAGYRDGTLVYAGRVGTGFDEATRRDLWRELSKLERSRRPFPARAEDEASTTWVEPSLVGEVRYASITPTGVLREAVWVRLRPDVAPESCQLPGR
jgi:DNA ligase D-like protein (predicted ligase)/DNA ligase D-like protein (predicted polymerase)/DNA ligase D-like protein (predicted 3'-phosphoesterase)